MGLRRLFRAKRVPALLDVLPSCGVRLIADFPSLRDHLECLPFILLSHAEESLVDCPHVLLERAIDPRSLLLVCLECTVLVSLVELVCV